jgi:hypothetical protein
MPEKLPVENILPMSNVGGEKLKGQPDVVLNLDAFSNKVEKRQGRSLLASLTNCHSVEAIDNSYFLVGATGSGFSRALWLVELSGNKLELAELPDFNKLYYQDIGDKSYISSKSKSFIFNKITRTIESWGVEVPIEGPEVTVVGGGLAPGKYHLTFTRKNALGELSGSGPVTEVDLSITAGISVSNLDPDYTLWITEPNGIKFFYAGNSGVIQRPSGGEILPTQDVTPPNGLENLIFFRGRIWGTKKDTLLYSDSYAFSWFRPYNSFNFKDTILMVAEDVGGIYIGTKKDTYYLSGNNIREMSLRKIGAGVIKGALTYAPVGPDDVRVPVWASKDSIFAGIGGKAASLTDDKIDMDLGDIGAAFFRTVKGLIQVGVNAPSSGAGVSDKVTVNVFREGRLINATYNEAVRDHISLNGEITEI